MTHNEACAIARGGEGAIVANLRQLSDDLQVARKIADERERMLEKHEQSRQDLVESLYRVVQYLLEAHGPDLHDEDEGSEGEELHRESLGCSYCSAIREARRLLEKA